MSRRRVAVRGYLVEVVERSGTGGPNRPGNRDHYLDPYGDGTFVVITSPAGNLAAVIPAADPDAAAFIAAWQ